MDVLLVNMPFHGFWPSLGLSLLKARLTQEKISSKVLYFGLPFAKKIGKRLYGRIANGDPRPMDLLGEWIFTPALNGDNSTGYVDEILRNRANFYCEELSMEIPARFIDKVLSVQSISAEFADQCAEEILRYEPKVVGFGSVFHQQISALSVAKRIKNQSPETFIVFGGGNCEGVMGAELARQFPFVDSVVSGEGEVVLPQIVKRRLANRGIDDLKGVFCASNVAGAFSKNQFPSAEKISHLDDLPFPDFEDYFEQQKGIGMNLPNQIVFETSRGCWWGEKSHCTFCGISPDAMTYRSKTGERAFREITYLTEMYNSRKVHVVDCILDMKYFRDFFPLLASRRLDLDLFYEVKANLKKDQVRILKEAGVNTIQPGIESFSNHILTLMGKGVKAMQNIQLLKWCKEYGIHASWNILWGFP
ncbi:MAG TPA: RiPP maturation radical SAM C-methyltransferase, partial [Acidobacteriota bacterium]|nr:RiPP maturation radical SAM C-methyltransferase [Acidobacteriota bacterium]